MRMFRKCFDHVDSTLACFCSNKPFLIVGSITILGSILRIYHLGFKSLWLDEAVVYWIAQGNLSEILTQNAASNSAPPLFALLVNLISRIGDSEAILRLPSCTAGIIAIPAIYFLARRFSPKEVAYLSSFIVAIAPSQVHYAQELREYSITFLLAILMFFFFHRYLCKQGTIDLIWLTVICTVGVFTQYGLVLLTLALNLILLVKLLFVRTQRRTTLIKWIAAQACLIGSVLIIYNIALKYQMQPGGFAATSYLASGYWIDGSLRSLAKLAVRNTRDLFGFSYPGAYLVFLIVCLGLLKALREIKDFTPIVMLFLPLGLIFATASARLYPYIGSRHNIFLTVMIYIFLGLGLKSLLSLSQRRVVSCILILAFALGGLVHTSQSLNSAGIENIKPLIETLSSSFRYGDRIYIYYGAVPAFKYYYQNNTDQWVIGVSGRRQPEKYFSQLNEVFSEQGRVWMIFSHIYYDEATLIIDYASQLRTVDEVLTDDGVKLFLAH